MEKERWNQLGAKVEQSSIDVLRKGGRKKEQVNFSSPVDLEKNSRSFFRGGRAEVTDARGDALQKNEEGDRRGGGYGYQKEGSEAANCRGDQRKQLAERAGKR